MQTLSTAITGANTIYNAANTLAQAKLYLERGFAPIPVGYRGKAPSLPNWPNVVLSEQELHRHFGSGLNNIGILLGAPSNGLIDVDVDDDIAVQLAPAFLPKTEMIFGRNSRPRSHWLYRCDVTKSKKFTCDEGMIVEIRGDGAQTVFPGSVHASGDQITFECDDEPAVVGYEKLELACSQLCVATILRKHWDDGKRHELSLAAAGFLANSGWKQDDVARLITAVANVAGDREVDDRLNSVSDTYEKIAKGMVVMGYAKLTEMLGQKLADKLASWCGSKTRPVAALSLSANVLDTLDVSSELKVADVFSDTFRDTLMFCDEPDTWFQRHNRVFRRISTVELQGIAKGFVRGLGKAAVARLPGGSWQTRSLESCSRINKIVELSRSDFRIDRRKVDQEESLLGLADGAIYDLAKGALAPQSDAIVTKSLATVFDEYAKCPRWEQFLDRIFDGDRDVISFVQRAVGYTLCGEVGEQCLFLLIGTGHNGKSKFIGALRDLFGDYAANVPMHTLMASRNGNQQTDDLALLPDKRFVSASEGEQNQRLAESKIKLMTGGDQITARQLYGQYFDIKPQFKLWIQTNCLPKVSGVDEAIWRRMRVIEFPVTIPIAERDQQLPEKLKAELPGILNWALQGYRDWKSQGLNPPPKVIKATSEYRNENDMVGQFIDVCCDKSPTTVELAKDLYVRYADWAEKSGSEPVSKETFGRTLGQKGFEKKARSSGSAWKGLKLKPTDISEFLQRKGLMQAAE